MTAHDDDPEALDRDDPAELLERRDPEAPEADWLDQAREVVPGERRRPVDREIDVPEADALEQAIEEPLDLEDDTPPRSGRDDDGE